MTATQMEPFAERFAQAQGNLSFEKLARRVCELLGDDATTAATLNRYYTGRIPEEKANPEVLWAVAEIGGVDIEWLSSWAAKVLDERRDFLLRACRRYYQDGAPERRHTELVDAA